MSEVFHLSWHVDFSSVLDGSGQITKYLGEIFDWSVSYEGPDGKPARKFSELVPVRIELLRTRNRGTLHVNGNLKMCHCTSLTSSQTLCGIERFSFWFFDGQSSEVVFLTFIDRSFKREKYRFIGEFKAQRPSCVSRQPVVQLHKSDILPAYRQQSLVKLSAFFKSLLDNASSCYSDVCLFCDGVSIPAHRSILSSRSLVFEAMFRNNMKESIDRIVRIEDVTLRALKAMLCYIYSGQICQLNVSLASEVLYAADKYDLKDLRNICSDYLIFEINDDNAMHILELGDFHDKNLKFQAIKYIFNFKTNYINGEISLGKTKLKWCYLQTLSPSMLRDLSLLL